MGVEPKIGGCKTPKMHGLFHVPNPMKMDELGVFPFFWVDTQTVDPGGASSVVISLPRNKTQSDDQGNHSYVQFQRLRCVDFVCWFFLGYVFVPAFDSLNRKKEHFQECWG